MQTLQGIIDTTGLNDMGLNACPIERTPEQQEVAIVIINVQNSRDCHTAHGRGATVERLNGV